MNKRPKITFNAELTINEIITVIGAMEYQIKKADADFKRYAADVPDIDLQAIMAISMAEAKKEYHGIINKFQSLLMDAWDE